MELKPHREIFWGRGLTVKVNRIWLAPIHIIQNCEHICSVKSRCKQEFDDAFPRRTLQQNFKKQDFDLMKLQWDCLRLREMAFLCFYADDVGIYSAKKKKSYGES